MRWGRLLGCHQRSDRSFFYKNMQFPICARCTGVLLGETIAIIAILFEIRPNIFICIACCGIIFIDWFLQKINILISTNIRRLITGILGGYGYMSIVYLSANMIIDFLIKFLFQT